MDTRHYHPYPHHHQQRYMGPIPPQGGPPPRGMAPPPRYAYPHPAQLEEQQRMRAMQQKHQEMARRLSHNFHQRHAYPQQRQHAQPQHAQPHPPYPQNGYHPHPQQQQRQHHHPSRSNLPPTDARLQHPQQRHHPSSNERSQHIVEKSRQQQQQQQQQGQPKTHPYYWYKVGSAQQAVEYQQYLETVGRREQHVKQQQVQGKHNVQDSHQVFGNAHPPPAVNSRTDSSGEQTPVRATLPKDALSPRASLERRLLERQSQRQKPGQPRDGIRARNGELLPPGAFEAAAEVSLPASMVERAAYEKWLGEMSQRTAAAEAKTTNREATANTPTNREAPVAATPSPSPSSTSSAAEGGEGAFKKRRAWESHLKCWARKFQDDDEEGKDKSAKSDEQKDAEAPTDLTTPKADNLKIVDSKACLGSNSPPEAHQNRVPEPLPLPPPYRPRSKQAPPPLDIPKDVLHPKDLDRRHPKASPDQTRRQWWQRHQQDFLQGHTPDEVSPNTKKTQISQLKEALGQCDSPLERAGKMLEREIEEEKIRRLKIEEERMRRMQLEEEKIRRMQLEEEKIRRMQLEEERIKRLKRLPYPATEQEEQAKRLKYLPYPATEQDEQERLMRKNGQMRQYQEYLQQRRVSRMKEPLLSPNGMVKSSERSAEEAIRAHQEWQSWHANNKANEKTTQYKTLEEQEQERVLQYQRAYINHVENVKKQREQHEKWVRWQQQAHAHKLAMAQQQQHLDLPRRRSHPEELRPTDREAVVNVRSKSAENPGDAREAGWGNSGSNSAPPAASQAYQQQQFQHPLLRPPISPASTAASSQHHLQTQRSQSQKPGPHVGNAGAATITRAQRLRLYDECAAPSIKSLLITKTKQTLQQQIPITITDDEVDKSRPDKSAKIVQNYPVNSTASNNSIKAAACPANQTKRKYSIDNLPPLTPISTAAAVARATPLKSSALKSPPLKSPSLKSPSPKTAPPLKHMPLISPSSSSSPAPSNATPPPLRQMTPKSSNQSEEGEPKRKMAKLSLDCDVRGSENPDDPLSAGLRQHCPDLDITIVESDDEKEKKGDEPPKSSDEMLRISAEAASSALEKARKRLMLEEQREMMTAWKKQQVEEKEKLRQEQEENRQRLMQQQQGQKMETSANKNRQLIVVYPHNYNFAQLQQQQKQPQETELKPGVKNIAIKDLTKALIDDTLKADETEKKVQPQPHWANITYNKKAVASSSSSSTSTATSTVTTATATATATSTTTTSSLRMIRRHHDVKDTAEKKAAATISNSSSKDATKEPATAAAKTAAPATETKPAATSSAPSASSASSSSNSHISLAVRNAALSTMRSFMRPSKDAAGK